MKKVYLIATVVGLCFDAYAQRADDILRYSFPQIAGTARSLGLAGAWGSAGADLSAASINPAGLGFYRRNELVGSMAVSAFSANANYSGETTKDGRTSFNIPNFGMVFNKTDRYKGKDATEGLVSGSFAFGVNRTNNFQQNQIIDGVVNNSSRANAIALGANGIDSANFINKEYDNDLTALAWRLRLIDNTNTRDSFASQFDLNKDPNYTNMQILNHKTRGRTNEYYVSGGLNISNFLYLGASIIINEIDYTSDATYTEKVISKSAPNPISGFTINEYFRTTGSGIGGKFGAIVRPADFVRFGFAYQTPIRHNLTDAYQNTLSLNFNGINYTAAQPGRVDEYEYQLLTPGRMTFSGSLLFENYGLINFDYEMVDYTDGRLTDKANSFKRANDIARNSFNNNGNNFRVGGEVNISNIKLRAGYAYYQNPFKAIKSGISTQYDASRTAISGGIGTIVNDNIFIDLAVVNWFGKTYNTLYTGVPEKAVISTNQTNFVLSAGFRF